MIIKGRMWPALWWWWWRLASVIILLSIISTQKPTRFAFGYSHKDLCEEMWDIRRYKPDAIGNCNYGELGYQNLPILDGVYCFNNGTGICKAFAGRFEFYFNSWTRRVLGSVPEGKYNDAYGYHSRVPISYNTTGHIVYADRPINWARYFTETQTVPVYNLMNSESFNWCRYADKDNWPYKTAFLDHDKKTRIYFHNRQSCITNDPLRPQPEHLNTRFVYNSGVRLDIDYNPTMFAMEDDLAKEIRLVKHMRQHWFEVGWRMKRGASNDTYHYIIFEKGERTPCRINATMPRMFTKDSYKSFTNLCISDSFTTRENPQIANNKLVETECGLDRIEIADYVGEAIYYDNKMHEVALHQIPRYPYRTQELYGVDVRLQEQWEKFAKDGYAFSANTMVFDNTSSSNDVQVFNVWTLLSYYGNENNVPESEYDQYYPKTVLRTFTASMRNGHWSRSNMKEEPKQYWNHLDDMAWLPVCKTILVVFGPLYTEYNGWKEFNLKTKTYLGPISNLGLNEMTNAFFAKEDKLYFYHRLNYVAEYKYTCGKRGAKTSKGYVDLTRALVTAKRVGNYRPRYGGDIFDFMAEYRENTKPYYHSEERFFKNLKVYKGELNDIEAPDVTIIQYDQDNVKDPEQNKLPLSVWALILLAVLGLLVLLLMGCITVRRIVRRRHVLKTTRSGLSGAGSRFGDNATDRSELSIASRPSAGRQRSSSSRNFAASGSTQRSGATSGRSTSRSHRSSLSAKNRGGSMATAGSSQRASSSSIRAVASPNSMASKRPSSGTVRSGRLSAGSSQRASSSSIRAGASPNFMASKRPSSGTVRSGRLSASKP